MNAYKRRYINALKKAAKINRYMKKGYIVFHDGSPRGLGFVLRDNQLLWRMSETCSVIYYENDRDWDHGYWTPIKVWNKDFNERFEVYKPEAKVAL